MTDPTPTPTAPADDSERFANALRELLAQRSPQVRRAAFEDALHTVTRRTQ